MAPEGPGAPGGGRPAPPLPVLVSIPHGGSREPPELAGRVAASRAGVLDDSDAFTAEIYGLRRGAEAEEVVSAGIARAFVDPNRPPAESPPEAPDGATKSETCFGEALYRRGAEPGAALRERLIERYHAGYHAALRAALSNPRLRLCVDCHSMAAEAPPRSSPDGAGATRPAFCLSDGGAAAADGAAAAAAPSCPRPDLERLASCIASSFGVGRGGVRINDPFGGGYIVRTYGAAAAAARRAPWVQIEMNRSLYLDGPQPSAPCGPSADPARLAALNGMFLAALRSFFG